MKKSKAILSAIALASAAFVSSGAQAADVSNPVTALEVVDNAAFFGAIFGPGNAGNTFTDKYTFDTTSMGAVTADILSFSANASTGLDILGFGLYDAGGNEVQAGLIQSTGAADSWTLSTASLAAGAYYVQVTGSVVSNGVGKYYANVALAPVPEPETYAMMLAGLGLVGFVARRRKQKAALAA